jgi:hypothetical protein
MRKRRATDLALPGPNPHKKRRMLCRRDWPGKSFNPAPHQRSSFSEGQWTGHRIQPAEKRASALKSRKTAVNRAQSSQIALVVLAAIALAPQIDAPMLEGAAGKQTHTAMVARNLHRGLASVARPRIDDVGDPGYFVKEFPALPAATAAAYGAIGGVDERILRGLAGLGWILSVVLGASILGRALPRPYALLGGAWMAIAPLAQTYGAAATNDPWAVAAALLGVISILHWRATPTPGRAALVGIAVAIAFLAKPHSAFWLGPAAATLVLARGASDGVRRPGLGAVAQITLAAALGLGLAGTWYAHGAGIHRIHPVPGATVPQGWTDASLLLEPGLWLEIARQTLFMALTPPGAVLGLLGLARGPRFSSLERAILAWGMGVWLQGLVFAPRMFDNLSRGTEYYQLPMLLPAGLLIARGLREILGHLEEAWSRRLITGATLLALALAATLRAGVATEVPEGYLDMLDDCEFVKSRTRPDDRFVVLADRGGTVLYYCDRRGQTFSLAKAVGDNIAERATRASRVQLAQTLAAADYLFVPFPELLDDPSSLAEQFGREWVTVPIPDSDALLFRKPRSGGQRRPR